MKEKYITFLQKDNAEAAIPLKDIRHFFSSKDVINGGYISFNNKNYFVKNVFAINPEDTRTIILLNNVAISLGLVKLTEFSKIIDYCSDFSVIIENNRTILVYKDLEAFIAKYKL